VLNSQLDSPDNPTVRWRTPWSTSTSATAALAALGARVIASAATATLVAALTIGALLRFWNINALGYNSDEAVYTGQAAALAGDPALSQFFPIFRAHPMVFQYTLSLVFSVFGVHDILGRSLVALIGLVTIVMVYKIGVDLYGRWTGVVAAALLAVMPYHVVVTRQVLLDGPLTFFTTLTLLLLVRYALTGRPLYLMGVGAGLGMTFMTKETGFVLAAATFAFLALTPQIPIRLWTLVRTGICMMVPILMFPLSIALAGRSDTAKSYLVWQLLRRPNHEWTFFPTVVPPSMGYLVIAAAIVGLIVLRSRRTWRETLLLAWVIIPTIVFQIWPVKGFQYLLPIAPAVVLLTARTLVFWRPAWTFRFSTTIPWVNLIAVVAIGLSLLVPAWRGSANQDATARIAGAGGIPGVREAGAWIQENVPDDAVFIAIGPSMANLIQFYGNRKAYGMAVSSNPLNRNPSYVPFKNPDAKFRYGDVHYVLIDSFSAARSPYFAAALHRYVEKYEVREIYSYALPNADPEAAAPGQKIIVIYEVSSR